jgi:hypothetical protein
VPAVPAFVGRGVLGQLTSLFIHYYACDRSFYSSSLSFSSAVSSFAGGGLLTVRPPPARTKLCLRRCVVLGVSSSFVSLSPYLSILLACMSISIVTIVLSSGCCVCGGVLVVWVSDIVVVVV